MYYRTFRGSFYVLYGALTIGLILTSVLSPLEYREVDGYELYVYGMRVVYDVPPNAATATTTTSTTEDPSVASNASESASSTLSLLDQDQEQASTNWLYQFANVYRDAVTSSDDNASTTTTVQKEQRTIYLHRLPTSKLRSVMIAYLFFAASALVACLVVITVGFLNVMPPTRYAFLSSHFYIVFVACMLLVTLTFAMATVCVSQNAMYRVIADDYYSQTELVVKGYTRKARSGFSCTVAAVGVGILMIVSIGVSLTRAI